MEDNSGPTDTRKIIERIKDLKERLERLRIDSASYRIGRGAQHCPHSAEKGEVEEDSHAVHLLPR